MWAWLPLGHADKLTVSAVSTDADPLVGTVAVPITLPVAVAATDDVESSRSPPFVNV